MATEPTQLPKRRANTWPRLVEFADGQYIGKFVLPAWKVTRCTASKDGGYLLRVVPTNNAEIEPFTVNGRLVS